MHFNNSYYEDEVREGFYIPGMIKRSFAVQLEVLAVVEDICKRHNIRWFADCGTLIGAVRHRSFIPWDDDLDICMLQGDYLKFLDVAKAELPEGYTILNLDTKEDYSNFLTRIVNTDEINTSPKFLGANHGFPYTAGIDIFPLNYLYEDQEKEEERRLRALSLWRLLEAEADGSRSEGEIELRKRIFDLSGYKIDAKMSVFNGINRALNKVFFECDGNQSTKIALMPFYIRYKNNIFDMADYDTIIKGDFEGRQINLPGVYEKILNIKYGGWERACISGGIHDYPFYKEQESILKGSMDDKLYYRYKLSEGDLTNEGRIEHEASLDVVAKILSVLCKLHALYVSAARGGDIEEASLIIQRCQEQAINAGTIIEKQYEEDSKEVKLLEDYCELLYDMYERLMGEDKEGALDIERLNDLIDKVASLYKKRTLEEGVLGKKEIIFIIASKDSFDRVRDYYEYFSASKDHDLYVMPVPYIEINCDRSYGTESLVLIDEPGIKVINYKEYDFEHRYPDEIVIVNGFDQYNLAASVHPFFYSSNIKKYTKKLVYMPDFQVERFDETCEKAMANARSYVLIPAISHADRILLRADWEKDIYTRILKDELGQDKSKVYEDKIEVIELVDQADKREGIHRPKRLLFYLGLSWLYQDAASLIKKLERAMAIFRGYDDRLKITWMVEAGFEDRLGVISDGLMSDYTSIKRDFLKLSGASYKEEDGDLSILDNISGFYGSPGYIMNQCKNKKIPVMLINVDV